MSHFEKTIDDFISAHQYYPSWSALESALREICNHDLQIKSLEIVKLDEENKSLHKAVLESEQDFAFDDQAPFPLTLIHKNIYNSPIALTRIGHKKSKAKFTESDKTALKNLHKYLNQQLQYCKDRDLITHNLNLQTEKFQAARQELKRMSQVKDNFLSIASHELRTPMSVIRGYADFLLSGNFGPLNDQQQSFLQKILTNVNHLTKLINNMLDVSKLEAGKMEFEMGETNLSQLIEEVVKDHQILLKEKQQTLKFTASTDLEPVIKTDTEKIQLVLGNLISNAYKFTPQKGDITVTLKPAPESDLWLISVSDTGIGISDADKPGLFEKFQQVDNSLQKKHTGTGLGLSICREVVEALGGNIWVEDNDPQGAIFNFTLPA